MAIYAALTAEDLDAVSHSYGLGQPLEAIGIPQGSINSNYRLQTPGGRLFLRHTTARSAADLQFEAQLLAHLGESGFPGPRIVPTVRGEPFLPLAGGRVTLFHYLAGEELNRSQLTTDHLERLGAELGKLHRLGNSFLGERENPYDDATVEGWLRELELHSDPQLRAIAAELLSLLARTRRPHRALIPRGVIHADIFLDNVKWLGDRVSAIFDFEMACRDALILDVAITLNAWCFEDRYQPALCAALLRGYQQERPFQPGEAEHLLDFALFGAIRYTASRIRDFHLSPLPPERLARKDFRTYLARARQLSALDSAGFLRLLGLE